MIPSLSCLHPDQLWWLPFPRNDHGDLILSLFEQHLRYSSPWLASARYTASILSRNQSAPIALHRPDFGRRTRSPTICLSSKAFQRLRRIAIYSIVIFTSGLPVSSKLWFDSYAVPRCFHYGHFDSELVGRLRIRQPVRSPHYKPVSQ